MNARRALAFIFCTVALDVLALGVMIPVLPTIVLGFMGGEYNNRIVGPWKKLIQEIDWGHTPFIRLSSFNDFDC